METATEIQVVKLLIADRAKGLASHLKTDAINFKEGEDDVNPKSPE